MNDQMHGPMKEGEGLLERRLRAAGWGLFFIWIGIAVLASVGWGAGLLGVGLLTLGGQVARKYSSLPVERFWVFVGALFSLGGAWELLGVGLRKAVVPGGLVPELCIAAGALLLVSAFVRRPTDRTAR